MMIKGIKCRRSRRYGWRDGNPETDKDIDGNPVEENYFVLVKIADCRLYEEDGRQYYDAKGVPSAVPLGYGATYYGYGKRRTNNRFAWIYDYKEKRAALVSKYETVPFYAVKKGIVYRGSIRHFIQDDKGEIMHLVKYDDSKPDKEYECICGRPATYMCECGCPCCGSDPCFYNCGGGVLPFNEAWKRGIRPRYPDDEKEDNK